MKNTIERLAKLDLPPTPQDMRLVVAALVRDNEISAARATCEVMLGHCHTSEHHDDDFYYWLGVSATLRAFSDGAFDRWRRRFERNLARSLKEATS